MHLLAAIPGQIVDREQALDLRQTRGDIVILSAADTELAGLAAAFSDLTAIHQDLPSLRLANLLDLKHNFSVDLYVENIISHAKVVIVRLLGGRGYWPYGIEQLVATSRQHNIQLALLPGDNRHDEDLKELSTVTSEVLTQLHDYFSEGGPENLRELIKFASDLIDFKERALPPRPLLHAGLFDSAKGVSSLEEWQRRHVKNGPVALIIFYRALLQANDLEPIKALTGALDAIGVNPLPIFVTSLKDEYSALLLRDSIQKLNPEVILNLTAFAARSGKNSDFSPLDFADCPVLQVVLSSGNEADWRTSSRGLSPRDLAMSVALPELDGRILTRAISFKSESSFDQATQCRLLRHKPISERVQFVAQLAKSWITLRQVKPSERRIAIVLANYPNRDGRIGNGVGLDTPAATINILNALRAAGYSTSKLPETGQSLIEQLLAGPTNALNSNRIGGVKLCLEQYLAHFQSLPEGLRLAVNERWGDPQGDPFFQENAFQLSIHQFGSVVLGVQPARGYNIDPQATYHDPALVPPHGYIAFYIWLRLYFGVHAIIHMGKHGNLEWLPGKALALSEECWPEAVFGPMPHLYPFIVNDPGEGTQAKRRAQAVIIDHLTPPLSRAEIHGDLAVLEQLVDEYFEAANLDPRRLPVLEKDIAALASQLGLDRDLDFAACDEAEVLRKLDAHLCELKELQIRDGLHIFGQSPEGMQLDALLVALTRLPRAEGKGKNASLVQALVADLDLRDFDPYATNFSDPYQGLRPKVLAQVNENPWRSIGDTIERLEQLALQLVSGQQFLGADWAETGSVLEYINTELRPLIVSCGEAEINGLLRGLDGKFVSPGPSGAPTRGRLDVLPTGRNFYSVDTRSVPTPAAWLLGWKSANLLLERHRQEHGDWPRSLALSAWGTANMRTGGDDIAQAMALIGVRPRWDDASRRVTGFEILPLDILDRPRIDVTLRISGFFRDAFPAQVELFDSAVRAVADLDEPEHMNPLANKVRIDSEDLTASGLDQVTAKWRAGFRIFGSHPGAYGAGLQALIDERGWATNDDLAAAYLSWSGYAYGVGNEGADAQIELRSRLSNIDAVVHNQDNREHDLLDSDDYYQFEGGLTVTANSLQSRSVAVYHNDHSQPERPIIRTLKEEIVRVLRGRAINPKWIAGCMRHGYKGAFEMAATVDYLFGFAATTRVVEDHHFDLVYNAYLKDDIVRTFISDVNAPALQEIAARLREAIDRGLWRPQSNTAHDHLRHLMEKAS